MLKPAPATFTGARWLSAEQLEVKQEWSGDFEQMKVGEPLTRTLTLLAKGATLVHCLNSIPLKTDERLKTYPDQPVLKEQKNYRWLVSFSRRKNSLNPLKTGSYTLPAIKIPLV